MLSNETVRKLHEMRLGVMAEAFSAQLEDAQFQALPFEDRFAMLVDAEWSARKSNRLTRLIRNAGYADPAACVENIEYHPERRLNREQILRLASCTYLQEAHNVIILGATGAGKTYLACALGMAASRSLLPLVLSGELFHPKFEQKLSQCLLQLYMRFLQEHSPHP